jgi:hypothetical protein
MSLANFRDLIIIIFGILGILMLVLNMVLALMLYHQMRLTLNKIKDRAASAAWIAGLVRGLAGAINLFRKPITKKGESNKGG